MKPSLFNYFFRVDDQVILAYNTLSTALVELSEDEFSHIDEFLQDPHEDFFESRGLTGFKDQLAQMGMIIPEDDDEIERIRLMRSALKSRERHLGLTVVPTLNCNFRCNYCFSYASTARMDADVKLAFQHFAEEMLKEVDSLSVSWFGGEPTLCMDIIEDLSGMLSSLCEEYNVSNKPGSIVTNGYLLTPRFAKRLKDAGISRAQVTLDGDRETHDRRRPLRGGQRTFDRILNNIEQTNRILDIQIRINIDHRNAGIAMGALDALASRNLQDKVGVYFGQIKQFTEACSDVTGVCLSNREFSKLNLDLTKEAISRGFRSFPYPQLQIGGVCGADKRFNYVVSPEGYLFKCWAEASLGKDFSVGSLLQTEANPVQSEALRKFLSWDPLAFEQCQHCRLLPLCMGGCPHLRIRHNQEQDCSNWRYNLLETLAVRYKLSLMTNHSFNKIG